MTTSYKPFFAGALIIAADKFILMQSDMNSSLYFGLSGAIGIFGAQYIAPMLPNNQAQISTMLDTKTLETRVLEIAIGTGATVAINKFVLNNDLRPNDILQKVGVILAADFVSEYIDDYMNNRPLSFLK
jgi:hypothetical protein